ncbi:MAG: carotenoid biosynthesis protein [Chloracidobacterium sp.]|uniref:Carotenoid biosynthesis protein n=1 Tax=Chloracidobacterium validum TaxID=2821543 RepID=A0ABX8BB65_9BACT|nr:carotenoid biosynthesis protein [Chloracidobacterium validum]QUW04182.1 carotenoid biosynthesis protein [Chloracidobacterium validum]
MTDTLQLLVGTVALRPYVFVFLLAYLFLAVARMGWLRTLVWTVTAYLIAFACEWSSIHNGFPFGLYHYIDRTSDRELWVAGVPFFDSLSFAFLSFISFEAAVLLRLPWTPRPTAADDRAARQSWWTIGYAGLLMMLLDIVIDPVTLQGERWFLGKLYYYPQGGPHFGVTIENYVGWFIVGVLITTTFRLLDATWLRRVPPRGAFEFPCQRLAPLGVYFGIFAFNIAVTFWIGETTMGWASTFLVLVIAWMFVQHLTAPRPRAAKSRAGNA